MKTHNGESRALAETMARFDELNESLQSMRALKPTATKKPKMVAVNDLGGLLDALDKLGAKATNIEISCSECGDEMSTENGEWALLGELAADAVHIVDGCSKHLLCGDCKQQKVNQDAEDSYWEGKQDEMREGAA